MNEPTTLDRDALDARLRTMPVHVLYFDGALICSYAAPAGDGFPGLRADELIGQPIEGIFPAGIDRRSAEIECIRASALVERVRTKLTVIRGFAQLLRRRLGRSRPSVDAHELDRISDAIGELDLVLAEFEDVTRARD